MGWLENDCTFLQVDNLGLKVTQVRVLMLYLVRFLIFCTVFLICSILADRFLHILGYSGDWDVVTYPPNQMIYDKVPAYVDSPQEEILFRTNAEGARYGPVTKKRDGEKRAIVSGDSLTMGWFIDEEQRFSNLMEDSLGFPVINVGMGGKEALWYAVSFDYFNRVYDPDYYFCFIFVNDVVGTEAGSIYEEKLEYMYRDRFSKTDKFVKTVWPHFFVIAQKSLGYYPNLQDLWRSMFADKTADSAQTEESRVAILVDRAKERGIAEDKINAWKNGLLPEDVELIEDDMLSNAVLDVSLLKPDFWTYSLDIDSEEADASYQTMVQLLGVIIDNARNDGVKPFFVFLPHPAQYDPGYIKPIYKRLGVELREEWAHETSELQIRLSEFFSDKAVPFLDVTGAMRNYSGDKQDLYLGGGDIHTSEIGNRIIAETVTQWLLDNNYLGDK